MAFIGINYIAVVIAAMAGWLVGAGWYRALARPWLIALGKTRSELHAPSGKPSPVPFMLSLAAQLVMAYILAGLLIGHLGPGKVTLLNGIVAGFVVWLGFVVTTLMVNYGFARHRREIDANCLCGH